MESIADNEPTGDELVELEKEIVNEILDTKDADDNSQYGGLFSFFSREIDKHPRLTREQESTATKEELINCNFRFVLLLAQKYQDRGLHLLDLIQEGILGLFKAVEKFDYHKGKFSTYACWWIRRTITGALADQSHTINISYHSARLINQLNRIEESLHQKLECQPEDAEIAEKMEIDTVKVRELKTIKSWINSISLSAPAKSQDSRSESRDSLENFVADKNAESPEEKIILAEKKQEIWSIVSQALGCANDSKIFQVVAERNRECNLKEVLEKLQITQLTMAERKFYIIFSRKSRLVTLREIGDELGVTQERIRQLETSVLKTLNLPKWKSKLEEFR